jgi:hypothetical protein
MGTWPLPTRSRCRYGRATLLAAFMLALALLAAGLLLGPVAGAQAAPAMPSVTSLNPTSGPQAGGNAVVISDNNFTNVQYVKFGDTNVDFTVDSLTHMSVLQYGTYDCPQALVNFWNYSGTTWGSRALPYGDGSISGFPCEYLPPLWTQKR